MIILSQSLNAIKILLGTVFGGLIGAVVALFLERLKNPNLQIFIEETANLEYTYPNANPPGKYKFFRARVANLGLPHCLSWLIVRETAQQVNAKITFK